MLQLDHHWKGRLQGGLSVVRLIVAFAAIVVFGSLLYRIGLAPSGDLAKPKGVALAVKTQSEGVTAEPVLNVEPELVGPSLWTRPIGEDWPHFLGKNYDGKSTEAGIRTKWGNSGLPLLWTVPLDTSYGIGSVAGGRMFLFDRIGGEEVLICLNAETGKELWRFREPVEYVDLYGYNNGPRTSPTIDGGRVFMLGVAGRLSCVAAVDGTRLWTRNLNQEFNVIQNFFGVSSNPIVIGDLLLVMVGGSPAEDLRIPPGQLDRVSPNGSAIVAFDKRTGKEIWRCGDDLASYSTPRPIRLADKDLLLAFARSGLLAVDVATGRQLWQFPWRADFLESVNAAMPVVRKDEVLISECYQIGSALLRVGLSQADVLRSDSKTRREKSMRAHWATPIEVDGFVYGCSGRNEPDSDLRCIRWTDGETRWVDPRRIRSSLLYVDGHFVVLEEHGKMQLIKAMPDRLEVVAELDLGAFAEDGRSLLGSPCWAAPILSHGLLYVRGSHRLACFELIAR